LALSSSITRSSASKRASQTSRYLAIHSDLSLEAARADPAAAHATDLFGGDEAGLLEHADVFLHAGEGHVELRRGR
jgi:hypothetical protein